jgi:hypothetical protein
MPKCNNGLIAAYLADMSAVINELETSTNPEQVKAGLGLVDDIPKNLRTFIRLKPARAKLSIVSGAKATEATRG